MRLIYTNRFPVELGWKNAAEPEWESVADVAAHNLRLSQARARAVPASREEKDRFIFLAKSFSDAERLDVDIFEEEGWIRAKYYGREYQLSPEGTDILAKILRMVADCLVSADREGRIVLTFYFQTEPEA